MHKPRRIAIVGGGPRGLFALDCLAATASETPDCPLAITLFEPAAELGAGAVYATDQPCYLLMNFVAGHIDAWDRSFAANAQRPSFIEWLDNRVVDRQGDTASVRADPAAYVPRALVGKYLAHCFGLLRSQLPGHVTLAVEHAFVSTVARCPQGWAVTRAGVTTVVDEVLIVTGHQHWQRDRRPDTSDESVLPVFPARRLAAAPARGGNEVYCKGFGLTFIDAALAMTAGRGGYFVRGRSGQLAYQASGLEPTRIYPISRSGRPMLAKPEAGLLPVDARREQVLDQLTAALRGLPTPITDFTATVWPLFCHAADVFIAARPGAAARWFDAWLDEQMNADAALERLKQGWQVATGQAEPDVAVALALVWRAGYRALVALISHDGLQATAVDGFRQIATEMERIAFGPGAENIARLLALIDAGVVDLSLCCSAASAAGFDVDATIPAPYVLDERGPLPGLIEREHLVQTVFGTLAVDNAGRPMQAPNRQSISGLAIVGRMTEISVLGNDTLSRTLHPTLAQWAAQVSRPHGAGDADSPTHNKTTL